MDVSIVGWVIVVIHQLQPNLGITTVYQTGSVQHLKSRKGTLALLKHLLAWALAIIAITPMQIVDFHYELMLPYQTHIMVSSYKNLIYDLMEEKPS